MPNEVKPCPSCGGYAVIRKGNKNKHGYFVICRECGFRTAFFSDKYTSKKDNLKQAIESWNRRVDDASIQR